MHTKTMEGLIGARTNMELLNTPFRVFKEARRKGDTAMMERAMGYMGEFHEDAYECKEEADEGMKKDAEETRKIAEEQREEMIKNRREEREEQQKKLEEERKEKQENKPVDMVEISEDGKVLLKESVSENGKDTDGEGMQTDTALSSGAGKGAGTESAPKPKADLEPVFYSSAGEVKQTEDTGTKVSASV